VQWPTLTERTRDSNRANALILATAPVMQSAALQQTGSPPMPAAKTKPVSIALQGGGAHGAFTWGVLDRLLEDGRVDMRAITATSAGAMNAVAMVHGLSVGGADGARQTLQDFWKEVSRRSALVHTAQAAFPGFGGSSAGGSMLAALNPMNFFAAMSNFAGPYDFNPFDINPLRETLDRVIDFERVRQHEAVRIYLAATNVQSGRVRIFTRDEVTRDAVLASACLPQIFQAVEIKGEPYWDGGYLGNPSLYPLIYDNAPGDVILVMLNPIRRDGTPRQPAAIADRLNEITFNAPLLGELRAIAFVQKLLDENWLADRVRQRYRRINVHAIRADQELAHLSHESKFDTHWNFLTDLRDRGRRETERWLGQCYAKVGKASSVSIQEEFLDE
jgi:NTE family protein